MTVVKCIACNMSGHFTNIGFEQEIPVAESQNMLCGNCGNHSPGEGTHCVHCRFPLSQGRMKPIQVTKLHLYRKVG